MTERFLSAANKPIIVAVKISVVGETCFFYCLTVPADKLPNS